MALTLRLASVDYLEKQVAHTPLRVAAICIWSQVLMMRLRRLPGNLSIGLTEPAQTVDWSINSGYYNTRESGYDLPEWQAYAEEKSGC